MNESLFARCHAGVLTTFLFLGMSAMPMRGGDYFFSGAQSINAPHGPLLSGGLTLDLGATRVLTPLLGESGSSSIYTSASQGIWGSYAGWTFSGVATIYVMDGPPSWSNGDENMAPDHWIARATITGPVVGGWEPTQLNLFYFTSASGITGSELLPPNDPLSSSNPYDFQFMLELTDANNSSITDTVSGRLFSIQSIPEPTSGALLMFGFALLAAHRKQKHVQ